MTIVVLVIQCVVLCLLIVAIVVAWLYAPWPSPLIRWFLPVRKRWPEAQIRGWLKSGRYHRAFLAYFYRDPERMAPVGASLLAPADGVVTSVAARDGIRYVVIALSFWDMHVQRSPADGKILRIESSGSDFMDGEGREFAFLRQKLCPVQKRIVILADWGELAVRLITSLAARRIEAWVEQGQSVLRGERIGRILLGSTVVLEVPEALEVMVQAGDRVWAGQTAAVRPPGSM